MTERKRSTSPEFVAIQSHVLSYLEEVRGEPVSKRGRRLVPYIAQAIEALSSPTNIQEEKLKELEERMKRSRFGRLQTAWTIDTARDIVPSWLYNKDFPQYKFIS